MSDQNDTNTTSPTTINPVTSQDDQTPQPIIPTNPAVSAAPDVPVMDSTQEDQPASSVMPNLDFSTAPSDPVADTTPLIQSPTETTPTKPTPIEQEPASPIDNSSTIAKIATKISESNNILVALSSNPSVDEIASAIGLTLFLDRIGKRVTAIYSGTTPNALEFLKPEETFEQSADILQDFVIALNKEKADHLRYKLDGDYVKIFITPYRSKISTEDLEFSYGDFNVDLVIALDVANGVDLDAALREHGRIMHDATVINITTGNPGKLGEIEWSDKTASSVSEMIVNLLYGTSEGGDIEQGEATAFLTGIVAATNRFANASTTPRTMEIASRLMKSGANQQLVSSNITPDVNNELFGQTLSVKGSDDPTNLNIKHGGDAERNETPDTVIANGDSSLLDDLKTAEASLANAAAEVTPDVTREPLRIEDNQEISSPTGAITSTPNELETPVPIIPPSFVESPSTIEPFSNPETTPSIEQPYLSPETTPTIEPLSSPETAPTIPSNDFMETKPETVITPPSSLESNASLNEGTNKYGQMLEDALAGSSTDSLEPATPIINPTSAIVPDVASKPEINGVPEINYMPMPGDEILPPPPTPPISFDTIPEPLTSAPMAPIQDADMAPASSPTPILNQPNQATPLGPQPAMQDQVYNPQASNPGAFKIPGM